MGLSERLVVDHPYLFPPAKKPTVSETALSPIEKQGVNYYAFNIVALVCGLKISEIADLRLWLGKNSESEELQVAQIFQQISKAAGKVASALDCLAYANADNNVAHSEAGMAALIASIACHIRDGRQLTSISESAIRRHYLVDLIRGLDAKGHASDLAAYARVWSHESGSQALRNHYTKICDPRVFEIALEEFWFREQERTISRARVKRPGIDNVQKAVLRFYLSQKGVFAAINKSDTHHVDHVIPFKRATNWIKDEKGTLPIGAITNLALLPKKLNLSKGANTLDEWFSASPKGSEKSVKDHILDTHSEDQIWSLVPALKGESKELTRVIGVRNPGEAFVKLQDRIWNRMKAELLKL